MKNITIIELQEEQLDNINAASAGSFFKKIGKGVVKGAKTVATGAFTLEQELAATAKHAGSIIKKTGDALVAKCS